MMSIEQLLTTIDVVRFSGAHELGLVVIGFVAGWFAHRAARRLVR